MDVADLSFLSKMKLLFNGIKAPAISFKGKKIEGWATKEELDVLIG